MVTMGLSWLVLEKQLTCGRLSSRDGRRGTSSRGLQQRRREARDLQQGRLLQVDGAARHAAAAGRGRADAQGRRQY